MSKQLGCIWLILLLAFNLTIGAMSVGYLCETIWDKRPNVVVSVLVGMVVGEFTIPAAVVAWGLTETGIISPPLVRKGE